MTVFEVSIAKGDGTGRVYVGASKAAHAMSIAQDKKPDGFEVTAIVPLGPLITEETKVDSNGNLVVED